MTPEGTSTRTELCVNLCEIAPPNASADELEALMARACVDAGFPHCERLYVGSYFCENYFCALGGAFLESLRELCARHGLQAMLVVPVFGQAFLEAGERRIDEALGAFGDVFDEVSANDVARFLDLGKRFDKRLGLGRLFSKTMRDERIAELSHRTAAPELSAEALECLDVSDRTGAPPNVIELDPVADVVDVSRILALAPNATIALHLPYCYATTGRNCTVASIDEPVERKFRLGRPCSLQCLGVRQAWRTDEGMPYVKHGRTFFFENPDCAIAGTAAWRIVYT